MNNNGNNTIKLEADGQTTIISNITIRDETVFTFLQSTDEKERHNTIVDAIKIGIHGLKQMRMGTEINFIENSFGRMINKFSFALDPCFTGSYTYKFIDIQKDYFGKNGRFECILDPNLQGGPINKLQSDFRSEIQKLRDIIIKKQTEIEVFNRTPLKGADFENICEQILNDYVSISIRDQLERTTKTPGKLLGCYSGDFVISPQGMIDKKIVLETKDIDVISEPVIIKNLEQAMKNRDAKYGIFLIKYKEGLPKKLGWFHELSKNMIVCALGTKDGDIQFRQLPSLALEYAKLRLQNDMDIEKETFTIIIENVTELGKKLDRFGAIQTQCTNIDKANTEIREQATQLKKDISDHITKIRQAIFSPVLKNMNGGEK